jgi:ANTAR domain-containing protein
MDEEQRAAEPQADEELKAAVAANGAAIEALEARVEASALRADASDDRDDQQDDRMDGLQEHVTLDRRMIAELQAEGLVSTKHAAELEVAMRTARRIGAAIGIVMAGQQVDEESAFAALAKASQNTNVKLRVLAEEVVSTGDHHLTDSR